MATITMTGTVDNAAPSTSYNTDQPRLYAFFFPLSHPTFRFPVLRSVADQYGIQLRFYPLPSDSDEPQAWSYQALLDSYDPQYDPEVHSDRTFAIVSVPSDDDVATLLHRCTVLRAALHLWSVGVSSQESVREALRHPSSHELYAPFQHPAQQTWRNDVVTVGARMSAEEKRGLIEASAFMKFGGQVKLKSPDLEWAWWEERWSINGNHKPGQVRIIVTGRTIERPALTSTHVNGTARDWIDRLDLKKRAYIGNTSMESEMSLNMAQMAQSGHGKIVYDPFVGTGSLIIAAAALGAYVMGSDIDGRMMRGKGKAKEDPKAEIGILEAARQYGLRKRFLDFLTCDVTQNPWRTLRVGVETHDGQQEQRIQQQFLVDAIVADPPYGVRAGAKRLGHRKADRLHARTEPHWLPEKQGWSHEQEDYVPPTRPYSLDDLLADLLVFGAKMIKDGGRLVFWMPVMNEDEDEDEVDNEGRAELGRGSTTAKREPTPVPTGPEWDLIAVSTQDFGRWARRLVTLQRKPRGADASTLTTGMRPSGMDGEEGAASGNVPATAAAANKTAQFTDSRTQYDDRTGRFVANLDPKDFRNRYFTSASAAAATSDAQRSRKANDSNH
ncbi:unnamed protein product [Jaminaea pallidilutea]